MATILLVEDAPDLGLYEAQLLASAGHRVLRCWGAPTPFAACPIMRRGSCGLPDKADLIIFACGMVSPLKHRTYRGVHLLRAYRSHARYGRVPRLVVSLGVPEDIGGTGPIEWVEKFSAPHVVVEAAGRLLARSDTRVASRREKP